MKNFKSVNIIAIVIGLLGIGAGIYGAISEQEFSQYFITLVIGVSLAGVGFINWKNSNNNPN